MKKLDYADSGKLNEHAGVKIERKRDLTKLKQPMLVQSPQDEF